ncbi:MAG: hypothetical protein HXK22_03140 [Alloprevotella tannerae]|nr:hypothetical protein [Alloprevotella tannerae]
MPTLRFTQINPSVGKRSVHSTRLSLGYRDNNTYLREPCDGWATNGIQDDFRLLPPNHRLLPPNHRLFPTNHCLAAANDGRAQ